MNGACKKKINSHILSRRHSTSWFGRRIAGRKYINEQEVEDKRLDQLELFAPCFPCYAPVL
jgi:hypothetical protein